MNKAIAIANVSFTKLCQWIMLSVYIAVSYAITAVFDVLPSMVLVRFAITKMHACFLTVV